MYSVPNHPFWRKLFIELEKAYENIPWYYSRHIQIMYSTGPSFLNRLYTRYQEPFDLHSFPARWFHPIGLDEHLLSLNNLDPKINAVHLGKGSWEHQDSKILIFFYCNYPIILFVILTLLLPYLLF